MAVFGVSLSKIWQAKFKIPSPDPELFFDAVISQRVLEDGSVINDVSYVSVLERYKGLTADMWSVDTLIKTGNREMLRPVSSIPSSPLSSMDAISSSVDPGSIVLPDKSE